MNWAITLTLAENETIERRLETVLSYVIKMNRVNKILIYDIDATGQLGDQLTKRMNVQKSHLPLNEKELSILLSEEGQIFELDLFFKNSFECRFIVRDGSSIDIVSNGEKLPLNVVGAYKDLDVNLFHS